MTLDDFKQFKYIDYIRKLTVGDVVNISDYTFIVYSIDNTDIPIQIQLSNDDGMYIILGVFQDRYVIAESNVYEFSPPWDVLDLD